MDMHRVSDKADWELVNEGQWTLLQRVASRSHGWLTPGNVVSFVGLVLTLSGFIFLWRLDYAIALIFLALGRLADVADGYVANLTQTKSSIGEGVDASIDKLVLLAGAGVLWHLQIAPHSVLVAMLGMQTLIGFTSMYARAKNVRLHPSRTGKYGTVVLWFGVGFGVLGINGAHAMKTLTNELLLLATAMAAYAWCTYVRDMAIGGTKTADNYGKTPDVAE